MLDVSRHFNFLKNDCFGGRNFSLTTVFQGTKHGYKASEFHKRVDNLENILYIVKSEEHNRTFGGYYKIKMIPSSDDTLIDDKDAFII